MAACRHWWLLNRDPNHTDSFCAGARSGRSRIRRKPLAARGEYNRLVSFEYTMAGKWLATLKLIAPDIVRVAAVRDLASPSEMGMLGVIQAVIPAVGDAIRCRGRP